MKRKLLPFLVLTCFLSLSSVTGLFAQGSASTTVVYTGAQALGCCNVCGLDYWCINNTGGCGQPAVCNSQTFWDPCPAGTIVTNIQLNVWSAQCSGGSIDASVNSNVFPTCNEGSTGCLCSAIPCGMSTATTATYPCGISDYNYGSSATNTLQLCTGTDVCVQRVEIICTYAPSNQSTPPNCSGTSVSGPNFVCTPGTANYTFNGSCTGVASYNWTVPAGWSITAGQGTTSITVNAAAAASGNVCCTPANLCGSAAPVCLAVTGSAAPIAPTSATVDNNNFCAGAFPTITLTGVGGAGSTMNWYSGSCGGTFVGSGNPLTIASPGSTTTYYCNWTTPSCGTSGCASITVNVTQSPTGANAGPDQSVCGTSTSLAGNTPAVGTGSWSIIAGAGGSVTTPSSPTSAFSGVAGTTYTLQWTISNAPCPSSSDQVQITFTASPTAANAGPDQNICGTSTSLAGNTPAVGTGAWSIISGAGGSITTPSSPTSAFSGVAGTTYVLQWTITNAPCPASSDQVSITFTANPDAANAGPDQNVCGTSTSLAGNTPAIGTGTWSIIAGAGGSITTPSSPTSAFSGVAGTTYTLQWTISNAPCPSSSDQVQISFTASPTAANAGPDQDLCGVTSTSLAGNTPAVGTGTWTIISGAGGSITTPSSPTSAFSGVAGTTYVLEWTITNAPCPASSDQVTITFYIAATVSAGIDQDICEGSKVILNGIIGGSATSASWSGGTGIYTPDNLQLNITYTPSAAEIAAGTVTLTLTTDDPAGPCPAVSDQITITIYPQPIVSAGPDQSICAGQTVTLAGSIGGSASSATWSGGTGSYVPNANTLNAVYTPSAAEISAGTVTLTLTTDDPVGPCGAVNDAMTITINPLPVAPTSVTVDHSVFCAGDWPSITLTAIGGSGSNVNWYIGSCGGTLIGSGNPFTLIPAPVTTTTYYGAWSNGCGISSCESVTVTISSTATPPTSATVDNNNFCSGAFPNITLTAIGGSGVTCNWYDDFCGGNLITTGNPVTIPSPTTTTTYYTAWADACGVTSCASVTVNINPLPVAPTSATADHITFCAGDYANISLSATGGSGTTLNWYTGSCGGTLIGSGNPLSISAPGTTTTYYAAWQNGCGLSTCATVTVTVNPMPTVYNVTGGGSYCSGGSGFPICLDGSEIGVNYQLLIGGVPTGVPIAGTGSPICFPNQTAAGTYTVQATSGAGCQDMMSGSATITVFVNPIADAGLDVTIPNGTSTTLDGSASGGSGSYSYSWSPPGLLVNPLVEDPTTTNLSSTTTYTVTVTDLVTGCTATDQVTVTISGGPLSVVASAVPSTICVGQSVQLNALASGGSGMYTYSWSSAPAGFTSTLQNPVVSPLVTTTYTVTVNDGFNNATSSVLVTVNPLPNVYNVTGTGSYCSGGAGLPICLSGSDIGINYQLYNGAIPVGAPIAGTGAAFCFPNQTTAGTYTVIATNATTTCVDTMNGSAIITVNPNPIADAGFDVTIPNGTSTTLNGSASGGTGPYSYSWSPVGSLVNPNIQNPTTVNLSSTTTFTLTVTDANGCTGTDQVTVTITGAPLSANATATPAAICLGSTSQLNANAAGGSGTYTYSWSSVPAGFTSTLANPVVSPLVTTTYTVTVDDGFNTVTSSVVVTVNPNPTADAGPDALICNGSSTTLNATGAGIGGSYAWNPAIGLSSTSVNNPIASPATNMTYTVTVTDINGCTAQDDVNVLLINVIPANAGIDQTICSGQQAFLNASGGVIFNWTPAGTLSSSTISNPIATPLSTTTYTVTTTDANGCTSSDDIMITVNPGVTPFAGNDVMICSGYSTTLSASGGTFYSWSPSTGLSSTTDANPTANPQFTTTYIVTVSNGNGCSGTDDVTVSVNSSPAVNAGPDVAICLGSSTTLNASGAVLYSWSPNIGLSSTTASNPVASPVATQTYIVTGVGANGCSATDNVVVTVNSQPNADAGPPITICEHESAMLVATGGNSYLWSNGTANDTNIVYPTSNTTYTVTVTGTGGCSATDNVLVTVLAFDPPVITASGPTIFCDQPISVTLTSSPGFSSYLWSNGQTGQSINITTAGTYYCEGTMANGCSDTSNFITVASYPAPTAPVIVANGPTEFCEGEIISVDLSTSTSYYYYQWSSGSNTPSIHVTHAGTYSVTVTDNNGCTAAAIDPVVISYIPYPVAYMNYNASGTYIEFYNYSLNDSTYFWDFGDGTTSTLENPTHTYSTSGSYWVTFIVYNECGSDTVTLWLRVYTGAGIDENAAIENLAVYPIPTKDLLMVSFETVGNCTIKELDIVNMIGQLLYQEIPGNYSGVYNKTFSLAAYSSGIYYLQIKTSQGTVNKKIVVN